MWTKQTKTSSIHMETYADRHAVTKQTISAQAVHLVLSVFEHFILFVVLNLINL